MLIEFFRPRNSLLKKYMEGYYFLRKQAHTPKVEYLTFPNNFSIISLTKNTELVFNDHSVSITGRSRASFSSDLICHYKKPIRIFYEGDVNEITFYFRPLGLNAFLPHPLHTYTSGFFSAFIPFHDYETAMSAILNEEDIEIKRTLAEQYWLSKFTGFDHTLLQDAVSSLLDHADSSIQQLAGQLGTSRQNINRLFELHLCKPPAEFRKIQRFRDTLLHSIRNKERQESLTALSYDASFYDQSHLIKDFRSLTGLTPKAFFRSISLQENATVNWLYLQ